jgi:predicted alpha/beta superfamily hydrolase
MIFRQTLTAHPRRSFAGGTFAALPCSKNPLFDTYIIGSPWLSYGDGFIFKREELFAKRHKKLAAKVHLWVGDREESSEDTGLSDVIRFGAILESRKYKGLTLIKQIFADHHHNEVIAPGFVSGLKSALRA